MAVRRTSSLYRTDPVGVTNQPEFLNLAIEAETALDPVELLRAVKRVERDIGRRPTFRWGPRVVDIDILLYDGLVLETPELTIPHHEMMRRAFVLIPLAEIAPELVHPLEHRFVAELAEAAPGVEGVHQVESSTGISSSPN
jgi:2-amino-4-hydroxy-6-hydroxymethyldihydropteridine diphosphokinase